MDLRLVVAAGIAWGVGLAHSWLGEQYILRRLFRRGELPRLFGDDRFTRRTLRFAWHLTTLAWWGFGAILLIYGIPEIVAPRPKVLTTIAVTFLVSAGVTAALTRGRHLAWLAFVAIALLCWSATG